MKIKYEAVFGPQELFDGMMDDCEFIVGTYGYKIKDGKCFYCEKYNQKYGWSQTGDAAKALSPVIAMRRIIRTPTWSVADQKAGKLPEVDCIVTTYDGKPYVFVGESCNNDQWSLRDCETGKVCHTPISWVLPIESPEEKAKRLREEWCSNALDSASILSGMREYELKRLGGYIGNIYDALLTGELKSPSKLKGGE